MSIPDDVLSVFPPEPYAAVRDKVKDGDILLCQGNDAFSRLIRWSTRSPWSHIGLAIRLDGLDRVTVVEAVEKIGVRCVAFSTFVSQDSGGVSPYPGKILLARHDALATHGAPPALQAIGRFVFDELGSRFAPGEIVKIALRIAAGRLLGSRRTPAMLLPNDEFICSEFVAKAYEEAGLPIPWDGLGFIAPSDFANDPRLSPIAQIDVSRPPRPPRRGRGRQGAKDRTRPRGEMGRGDDRPVASGPDRSQGAQP